MLKIEFTAAPENAAAMGDMMARIGAALSVSHVEAVSISETAKRGPGRPRKADPVEEYQAAGGKLPPADPTTKVLETLAKAGYTPVNAVKQVEAIEPTNPAVPAETPTDSLDDLRAKLREKALEKGALWLRPILLAHKAAKIGELSEEALRDGLAYESGLPPATESAT